MTVNGIEVSVTKKPIKNMHLYVKPPDGRVEVSAPLMLNNESIEQFIRSKLDWIRRQKARIESLAQEASYASGEYFYLWGVRYCLSVNYGGKGYSLVLNQDKAILTVRGGSSAEKREQFINQWYRAALKAEIGRVLPKWELITGLHPDSWQIKNMITRWGTCNTQTRKIWLNLQLVKKAPECLEYVIVHELLHLKEKSHNEKFYILMDKYLPSWRETSRKLNEHCFFK